MYNVHVQCVGVVKPSNIALLTNGQIGLFHSLGSAPVYCKILQVLDYIYIELKFRRLLILQIFNRRKNQAASFHSQTAKVSRDNIPVPSCRICKEQSPRRYLRSRHCFADSWLQVPADNSVAVRCVFDKLARPVCHAYSILRVWRALAANLHNYFQDIFKNRCL